MMHVYTHTALCSSDEHSLSTFTLPPTIAHRYATRYLACEQKAFQLNAGRICHLFLSRMFVSVLLYMYILCCVFRLYGEKNPFQRDLDDPHHVGVDVHLKYAHLAGTLL